MVPWLLCLTTMLLSSVGATAATGATDTATFSYRNGFDADGSFSGECRVAGFRFDEGTAHRLELGDVPKTLVITRTWLNTTLFVHEGPVPTSTPTTKVQREQTIPLSADHATIEVPSDGHAYLTARALDQRGDLHTQLHGDSWHAGRTDDWLAAGPEAHYVSLPSGIIALPAGISGISRWIETDQDSYRVQGYGFLVMAGTTIQNGDQRIELPPHRQVTRGNQSPVAETLHVQFTRAALVIDGLDVMLDPADGTLACSDLAWRGTGDVTYRAANGTVSTQTGSDAFRWQELTLNGAFEITETATMRERPWGTTAEIDAAAEGRFVAGKDFVVVTGPTRVSATLVAASGLLLLLTSLLAWKWKLVSALFTRELKGDPLQHPVRAVLHDLAHQAPGANLAEAVRVSGRSYSTVRHHARQLERLGLITTHEVGGQIQIHPPATRTADAVRQNRLRDDVIRHVVLTAADGVQLPRLRAELQQHYERPGYWATRVIQRAERAGLVVREKTETGVMVRATNA